jgi:arylsulfatase A-like enzyme
MVTVSHSPRLDLFFDANRHKGKTVPPDRVDGFFHAAVARGHLKTGTLDDATTTEQLLDWLQPILTDGSDRPFYAMVSYQASHYPYEQGFAIPGVFNPRTFTELESRSFSFLQYPASATERMRNRYWNSLAYIDGQIAATVEFLRQRKALDNTVIIVFGDHGELFRENGVEVTHAGRLRDRTLNVMLVLNGAKGIPTGEYTQPVSLLDVGPMVLDLAGLPPYDGFQGAVPPGLRDPTERAAAANRPVFATVQNFVQEDSVQVSMWKYIEQSDGAYAYLFDLQSDPLEKQNVAQFNPDIGKCLRETLRDFRKRQLGYYANATLKASFFPPRHDLATSAACETAFPR